MAFWDTSKTTMWPITFWIKCILKAECDGSHSDLNIIPEAEWRRMSVKRKEKNCPKHHVVSPNCAGRLSLFYPCRSCTGLVVATLWDLHTQLAYINPVIKT